MLEHDIHNIAVNKNLIELTKGVEQQQITALMDQCRAIAVNHASSTSWKDILELNLVTRLIDLIQLWADSLALYAVVLEPHKKPSPILKSIVSINRSRPLHIDKGLAAYSGVTTVIATIACAAFVMATEWTQGASAVSLTAVMCCIFATADNPTVMQKKMFIATIIVFPVAFLYVFGIFPAFDSFPMLALSLFPLIMLIGVYLANPATMPGALSIGMIVVSGIGFTFVPHTDFVTFFMGNLIAMIGVLMALVVTLLIRVISTETSIHRILRAGWKELSDHAIAPYQGYHLTWASVMLDRLGLLIPRMATAPDSEQLKIDKALKGLPVGFNILDLRVAKKDMPESTQDKINMLMQKLSRYFLSMTHHGYRQPRVDLLEDIDVIINDILKIRSLAAADRSLLFAEDPRLHGLIASVGLRRNLFPNATAFQALDFQTLDFQKAESTK